MASTGQVNIRRSAAQQIDQNYQGPLSAAVAERRLGDFGRSRGGAKAGERSNISRGEQIASLASGSVLALLGLGRRDLPGLLIAGVGAALTYRGASGHCPVYERLGLDTAKDSWTDRVRLAAASDRGIEITEAFLIDRSPEDLFSFWRNFENLPRIMTHLESIQTLPDGRSHWVAKAPSIAGGRVEWDAEITTDEPNSRISWRSLPDSDVAHQGSVSFVRALGDRGTLLRVVLNYHPPAGQVGRWLAKLFGEEPEQQIRDDLRNFKRIMEVGEVPTIVGQPRGTCRGVGRRETE